MKLTAWTLDEIGIKSAVYLDPDTDRPQELRRALEPPSRIRSRLGYLGSQQASTPGPCSSTRQGSLNMVSELEVTDFRLKDAKQSSLNH